MTFRQVGRQAGTAEISARHKRSVRAASSDTEPAGPRAVTRPSRRVSHRFDRMARDAFRLLPATTLRQALSYRRVFERSHRAFDPDTALRRPGGRMARRRTGATSRRRQDATLRRWSDRRRCQGKRANCGHGEPGRLYCFPGRSGRRLAHVTAPRTAPVSSAAVTPPIARAPTTSTLASTMASPG